MKTLNLEILKSSTRTWDLTVKYNGVLVDLTDWTFYFTAKSAMDDSDANAVINKTITSISNATGGVVEIELDSDDTDIAVGSYWYSIDYKTDDDYEDTLYQGKLTISKPVRVTR